MKKIYSQLSFIFKIIPVLLIVILFSGCPYSSSVPISETGVEIPDDLLGEWIDVSGNDPENRTTYLLSKNSGNTFELKQITSSEYEPNIYTGHFSLVNDVMFINLKEDFSTGYYLYRLDRAGSDIVIKEVTKNITKEFTTSSELREYMDEYMHLDFFYNVDNERRLTRIE